MNPDFRKQQLNPDGQAGHNERDQIYSDIKRVNKSEYEKSERLLNIHMICDENQSLADLQIDIRMNQCKERNGSCYQNRSQCLQCLKYHE